LLLSELLKTVEGVSPQENWGADQIKSRSMVKGAKANKDQKTAVDTKN
jgi:hypothetical protein